ncbi:uncharacterized protein LOC131361332 [Hemibagrus wyckioides]|uniref:uncharacterized protein LOC131361332 n=1 Tax=Hemibagrus wyckioides TaxID=337641 RepID=UPI00266B5101|nr:uncharacterized protein LOC131361332 [Hemibagrus wyckioides]XP_058258361.1 uncharacterized protein LOC131361332 [Hemibagrus wyckioides]
MSQRKTSLRFVTWNIGGIKNPQPKCSNILKKLQELESDIVFLQETHIGPDDEQNKTVQNIFLNEEETIEDETEKKWNVYFTVHSSQSKGVAILIRENEHFEYICCDEDCSGGYIVLFCRMYGECYTLVNVYNHNKDRIVLGRLKQYLIKTAEGVLVVGGDFNTVLNPSVDRQGSTRKSPLKAIFQDFTTSLNIIDTWSHKHTDNETKNRYTCIRGDSASRIDMFFLKKDTMKRMTEIEVKEIDISDHYPLVLELRTKRKCKKVPPKLKQYEYNSDWRAGKISGAEILSAIKCYKPDQKTPENWCSETETLKEKYNLILKSQQVPNNFKYSDRDNFTGEYLIFSEVLAKRLNAFISLETKSTVALCCISVVVIFESSKQEIKWSFLKARLQKIENDYEQKNLKQAPFVPPPEFGILDFLLPKPTCTSEDLRDLQPGCPLTSAVLNLALNHLNLSVRNEAEKTIVCYHKQMLFIHVPQSKQKQVFKLVREFQEDSGVRLMFK